MPLHRSVAALFSGRLVLADDEASDAALEDGGEALGAYGPDQLLDAVTTSRSGKPAGPSWPTPTR